MKLSENQDIEQVCLVGSGIPQPIALVVLSEKSKLNSDQIIKDSLSNILDKVNNNLDSHEKINNIVVVQDQWTVENKLLTPTMKIKRKEIENLYIENYNNWYIKDKVLII